MKCSSWLVHIVALGASALVGCSSSDDPSTDETTHVDERKPLGKADLAGTCSENGVSHCGGKSAKKCYCDDACTGFGDCCGDYASVCGGAGPILDSIRLSFAKQYRILKDDDVFIIYVSGHLASSVSPIQEVELAGPSGEAILDKAGGVGNFVTGEAFAVPDPERFQIQTQDTKPYPVGSYSLSLQLANGSKFTQTVNVERTDPLDRVSVTSPTSNEVVTDSTPQFQFDPYVSPFFTGDENRSLLVSLETVNFRAVWEESPADPDQTKVAVGDPAGTGAQELSEKTEYVLLVSHLESRKSGFVDVALENRASVHFFFQ